MGLKCVGHRPGRRARSRSRRRSHEGTEGPSESRIRPAPAAPSISNSSPKTTSTASGPAAYTEGVVAAGDGKPIPPGVTGVPVGNNCSPSRASSPGRATPPWPGGLPLTERRPQVESSRRRMARRRQAPSHPSRSPHRYRRRATAPAGAPASARPTIARGPGRVQPSRQRCTSETPGGRSGRPVVRPVRARQRRQEVLARLADWRPRRPDRRCQRPASSRSAWAAPQPPVPAYQWSRDRA